MSLIDFYAKWAQIVIVSNTITMNVMMLATHYFVATKLQFNKKKTVKME